MAVFYVFFSVEINSRSWKKDKIVAWLKEAVIYYFLLRASRCIWLAYFITSDTAVMADKQLEGGSLPGIIHAAETQL